MKIFKNGVEIIGRSKAAATSKMERFVIIVDGFKPITIITKRSILDVAATLDPPLKPIILLNRDSFKRKFSKIFLPKWLILENRK